MRRGLLLLMGVLLLFACLGIYAQRGLPASGSGWVAKRTCSGLFVAERSLESLVDASLPLPLPFDIPVVVDSTDRTVTARVKSLFLPEAPAVARYHPGFGCIVEGRKDEVSAFDEGKFKGALDSQQVARPFPKAASTIPGIEQAVDSAFRNDDTAPGHGTRALLVVHKGQIIAERYAPGFSKTTPLAGWSMAKSVTSAIVGLLVDAGRIATDQPVGLAEWSAPGDPRGTITWDQLLRMSSGLSFSENYVLPSSDAIQMLFGLERFAKGRYAAMRPLAREPDTFWSYSSGTTNVIQYALLQNTFRGDLDAYLSFPHEALFSRIGMTSAVLEPDASGVYVGSSFLYATARDWARFGLLYLNQGEWNGQRILSREWIQYTGQPTPTEPAATYGAHWWLNADPESGTRRFPSLDPNLLIASGFEGQSITIVPDHDLVVVRLGLDRGKRLALEPVIAQIIENLP